MEGVSYYLKSGCLLFGNKSERNGELVAVIDDPEWAEIIVNTLNAVMELKEEEENNNGRIRSDTDNL